MANFAKIRQIKFPLKFLFSAIRQIKFLPNLIFPPSAKLNCHQILGTLDEMVRAFLLAVRNRGVLVSSVIAVSPAKALIVCNPHLLLSHIDLDLPSWAKSLFKRMGFRRRMKTTVNVEIPKETHLFQPFDLTV